jgi:hypothetical protein
LEIHPHLPVSPQVLVLQVVGVPVASNVVMTGIVADRVAHHIASAKTSESETIPGEITVIGQGNEISATGN